MPTTLIYTLHDDNVVTVNKSPSLAAPATLELFDDRSRSRRVSAMAKKTSGERERFWRELNPAAAGERDEHRPVLQRGGVLPHDFVWRRRLRAPNVRGHPDVGALAGPGTGHAPASRSSVPVPELIADLRGSRAEARNDRSRVAQWRRAASAGGVQWPRRPRRREGLGFAPRRREGIMLTFPDVAARVRTPLCNRHEKKFRRALWNHRSSAWADRRVGGPVPGPSIAAGTG